MVRRLSRKYYIFCIFCHKRLAQEVSCLLHATFATFAAKSPKEMENNVATAAKVAKNARKGKQTNGPGVGREFSKKTIFEWGCFDPLRLCQLSATRMCMLLEYLIGMTNRHFKTSFSHPLLKYFVYNQISQPRTQGILYLLDMKKAIRKGPGVAGQNGPILREPNNKLCGIFHWIVDENIRRLGEFAQERKKWRLEQR